MSKTGAARLRPRALVLLAATLVAAAPVALLLQGAGATAATPTAFGRVDPGSAWLAMSADYKRSSRFQLPETAAVTHLVAHVDGLGGLSGSQQLRFAVYADNGGVPGALLGQTDIGTVSAGQAAGWLSLPMQSPLPLEAGTYHLAIHSGPTGSVARYSRVPDDDVGLVAVRDAFADGPAASFGNGTADDWQVAVHALLAPLQAPDTQAPTAPASLAVSTGTSSLALSWAASTDDVGVSGYGVYLNGSRVADPTATAHTFSGLACDTSFVLAVDAVDAAGNRSAQSSLTARTTACAAPPIAAPGNLRVLDASETSVTVAWDPVVGAVKYGAYSNGTRVAEPVAPSFTFEGLTCGASYTLAADAVDVLGTRSAQASISVSTQTCPPPPPAAPICTKTLAPGGSLGTFLNGLRAGEVGCLRGGTYSAGDSVVWSASGGTVQAYPGESPVVVGTRIWMSGTDQTIRGFTIRDVLFSDGEPLQISGTRARVEEMELANANEHGILLNSSARDATIARNYIHDVGHDTLDHGIYVQGSGHRIVNNLIARPSGYGVHLYSSPSNVVVAQNTLVASRLRAGVLVRTSGTGVRIVNNIVAENATHGINYHSCGGGCLVDANLAWSNPSGAISSAGLAIVTNLITADPLFVDELYRVAALSPAVDSARPDYSFSPARDGVARPQGGAPDKGVYERAR